LFNKGKFKEAETVARAVTKDFPEEGFGWKCLGAAVKSQGRTEDSLEPMQRAASLLPDDAEAHSNLGVAFKDLGRLHEAESCYRRSLEINPYFAEALNNLGVVLKEKGLLAEAEYCCCRSLGIKPNIADTHSNLGTVYMEAGRLAEAEACHRSAIKINPAFSKAHYNLGNTLKDLGRFAESEVCYRRALEIAPDYAEAHCNLGALLKDIGRMQEAESCCRQALDLKPDLPEAHSVLLFVMNYSVNHHPFAYLEEARKYGCMVSKKVAARFSKWNCELQPKRLKVGLVSGDLNNHPVGHFLETVLAQINPSIEMVAYQTDNNSDDLTLRIRPYISTWKTLMGLNDEAAAALIHADGIHLLLDLSGHTSKNRLPMFAWKPAPVQASWLGYPATTGVSEIDYLLADRALVPKGGELHFTEKLWYLPDIRICLSPPFLCPDVSELPALKAGYITFGCFQNLAKIDYNVLELWSTILAAVPASRVRFQSRQLDNKETAEQFLRRLQSCGIDPARVSLFGASSREEYLAAHAEVDIVFDTFPYTGCTTTAEALWMGVPSLSLAGNSMISRQGVSLLGAVGLSEWVATDEADYSAKAAAFATDLPGLAALRKGLRQRAMASPLFDAARFARNLEDALWGMWEKREVKCDDGVIS